LTIKYKYWTSQPYNIFDYDYSSILSTPTDKGTIKEKLNSFDYVSSGFSLSSNGVIRDVVQYYTTQDEFLNNTASIQSAVLESTFSGTYTYGAEYLNNQASVQSAVLTTVLVNYDNTTPEYLNNTASIQGAVLTGF
jgi:hypothetical protein